MGVVERLRSTRLDAALALGLVAAGLAQLAVVPFADPGVGVLYVLGSMLPLPWRRTFPVESALVSSAFWLVPLEGYPILGFVAVLLQFFALGDLGRPLRAVVLTTAWATATSVVGTLLGPEVPVAAVGAVLVVVAPVLAGRVVRRLREQNESLTALSRELQEERRRAEEAAVGGERARIAQELHDVLGHELTLIAIQAEAAGVALHVDPDRVAAPVETIRTTAHRALAEIREVVGVLAATPGPDQSQPTEDLVVLTDRARDAGVPNTLSVTGTPEPAHSAVGLAVHRIVRECLTNAGRHAPGEPVTVAVDWAEHEVAVAAANATDPGAPVAPGRGLTGIRHRAELLGGTYRAGAVGSRFEVRVVIPRPERVPS
ncbi:sensor histidine kinase [Phycicoccus ginsengisoli]